MVATLPAAAANHTACSSRESRMPKFNAVGRRQLLGLSQAIRKHAHHSTSPSSEFKYGRNACRSSEALQGSRTPVKTAPTIEDRLLSLLNSDTEGGDGQSSSNAAIRAFEKPPTLASKGCQGSYSPRLAESKLRAARLNRTMGDEPSSSSADFEWRVRQQVPVSRVRSLSAERVLEENPRSPTVTLSSNSPCVRRTRTDRANARQRRCVSAVPASFYNENWNDVPEYTESDRPHDRMTRAPGSHATHRTPTGYISHAASDQRPSPSLNKDRTLPMNYPAVSTEPLPARIAARNQTTARIPDGPNAPKRNLEYLSSNVFPSAEKESNGAPVQQPPVFQMTRSPQVPPLTSPHKTATGSANPHAARPNSPTKTVRVVERNARQTQHAESPTPAYLRTPVKKALEGCGANSLKVSSVSSMSSQNTAVLHPARKPGGKQRAFSPRSRERLYSTKIHDKAGDPCAEEDPESSKSEDRDSGAILDAEASVFDFDSSVMSESEAEASRGRRPAHAAQDTHASPQRRSAWSRSGTPTLPPLSPFQSDDETPRNSESQSVLDSKSRTLVRSPVRNEVACLPSYEALLKMKQAEAMSEKETELDGKSDGGSHDHQELSPTESALAESCMRQKAPITAKNAAGVKVVTKSSDSHGTTQRRASSRASSCDERRGTSHYGRQHRVSKRGNRKKNGHKQYQDNEERNCYDLKGRTASGQRLGRYPVFYRPGEECVEVRRDVDETSSVRSFTSASVSSSVLRRHGRRRHGRHHALDKAYAKEVRAVTKRFSRLEAHVVTLARSVAQLSSEIQQRSDVSRDVEELRSEIEEMRRERSCLSRKSSSSSHSKPSKSSKKSQIAEGQPKRVVKLTKFFGEKPPILSLFLTQMGYKKYVEKFDAESIGMLELPYMDEERLKSIGIPLGPRIRILNEAKKTCLV